MSSLKTYEDKILWDNYEKKILKRGDDDIIMFAEDLIRYFMSEYNLPLGYSLISEEVRSRTFKGFSEVIIMATRFLYNRISLYNVIKRFEAYGLVNEYTFVLFKSHLEFRYICKGFNAAKYLFYYTYLAYMTVSFCAKGVTKATDIARMAIVDSLGSYNMLKGGWNELNFAAAKYLIIARDSGLLEPVSIRDLKFHMTMNDGSTQTPSVVSDIDMNEDTASLEEFSLPVEWKTTENDDGNSFDKDTQNPVKDVKEVNTLKTETIISTTNANQEYLHNTTIQNVVETMKTHESLKESEGYRTISTTNVDEQHSHDLNMQSTTKRDDYVKDIPAELQQSNESKSLSVNSNDGKCSLDVAMKLLPKNDNCANNKDRSKQSSVSRRLLTALTNGNCSFNIAMQINVRNVNFSKNEDDVFEQSNGSQMLTHTTGNDGNFILDVSMEVTLINGKFTEAEESGANKTEKSETTMLTMRRDKDLLDTNIQNIEKFEEVSVKDPKELKYSEDSEKVVSHRNTDGHQLLEEVAKDKENTTSIKTQNEFKQSDESMSLTSKFDKCSLDRHSQSITEKIKHDKVKHVLDRSDKSQIFLSIEKDEHSPDIDKPFVEKDVKSNIDEANEPKQSDESEVTKPTPEKHLLDIPIEISENKPSETEKDEWKRLLDLKALPSKADHYSHVTNQDMADDSRSTTDEENQSKRSDESKVSTPTAEKSSLDIPIEKAENTKYTGTEKDKLKYLHDLKTSTSSTEESSHKVKQVDDDENSKKDEEDRCEHSDKLKIVDSVTNDKNTNSSDKERDLAKKTDKLSRETEAIGSNIVEEHLSDVLQQNKFENMERAQEKVSLKYSNESMPFASALQKYAFGLAKQTTVKDEQNEAKETNDLSKPEKKHYITDEDIEEISLFHPFVVETLQNMDETEEFGESLVDFLNREDIFNGTYDFVADITETIHRGNLAPLFGNMSDTR